MEKFRRQNLNAKPSGVFSASKFLSLNLQYGIHCFTCISSRTYFNYVSFLFPFQTEEFGGATKKEYLAYGFSKKEGR